MKENACGEQDILNKREYTSPTLHRFQVKEHVRRKHYKHEYEITRTRSYQFLTFDIYKSSKF